MNRRKFFGSLFGAAAAVTSAALPVFAEPNDRTSEAMLRMTERLVSGMEEGRRKMELRKKAILQLR